VFAIRTTRSQPQHLLECFAFHRFVCFVRMAVTLCTRYTTYRKVDKSYCGYGARYPLKATGCGIDTDELFGLAHAIAFRFGICTYSTTATTQTNSTKYYQVDLRFFTYPHDSSTIQFIWVIESSFNPLERLAHDSRLAYVSALQLATHANQCKFCTVWRLFHIAQETSTSCLCFKASFQLSRGPFWIKSGSIRLSWQDECLPA
jgi:hypothetical protein